MEMKLLCIVKKRGVDTFATFVTAENTDHATHVKAIPGVGKPFLLFATLPDGNPASADFSNAPVVSSDVSVNQTAIDAMLADPPWDALNY